jgi:hypothetical protein
MVCLVTPSAVANSSCVKLAARRFSYTQLLTTSIRRLWYHNLEKCVVCPHFQKYALLLRTVRRKVLCCTWPVVRTTWPATRTSLAATKVDGQSAEMLSSRLRFLYICHPTYPLVACEWRETIPNVGQSLDPKERLSHIGRQAMIDPGSQ